MPARVIIEPFQLGLPRFREEAEKVLDDVAALMEKDFQSSMQTYKVHKAPVNIERDAARRVVSVTNDIYYFTNFGTKVRYAVMTPGFYPKTTPGVLQAGVGMGQMRYVGKKPRAGIVARRFDLIIMKEAQAELTARFTDMLTRLAKKQG